MLKLRPHTSKCLNRALGHLRSNSELLVSEKKGNLKLSWRVVSISHQKFIWTLKMVSIIFIGKAVVLFWFQCSKAMNGGAGVLGCPADLGLSPCVFLGYEARNTQSTRNMITPTSIVSSGIYLPTKGPNGRKACQDQSPEQLWQKPSL